MRRKQWTAALSVLAGLLIGCGFSACAEETKKPTEKDTTAPQVEFRFKENQTVSLVNGEFTVQRDQVFVAEEGTLAFKAYFGEKEIPMQNDTFSFSEGVGKYEVEATAADEAGNQTVKRFSINVVDREAGYIADFETASEINALIMGPTKEFSAKETIVDYATNVALGETEAGKNHAFRFTPEFLCSYSHFSFDLGFVAPAGTTVTFDYFVWYEGEIVETKGFLPCVETSKKNAFITPARADFKLNEWQTVTVESTIETRFIEVYNNLSPLKYPETSYVYIDNIRFLPVACETTNFTYNFSDTAEKELTLTKADIANEAGLMQITNAGARAAELRLVGENGELTDFENIKLTDDSYYQLAICNGKGERIFDEIIEFTGYASDLRVMVQEHSLSGQPAYFVHGGREGLPAQEGVDKYVYKLSNVSSGEIALGFGYDADEYAIGDKITTWLYIGAPNTTDQTLTSAAGSDNFRFWLRAGGMWSDWGATNVTDADGNVLSTTPYAYPVSILVNGIPYVDCVSNWNNPYLNSNTYGALLNTWVKIELTVNVPFTGTDTNGIEDLDTSIGLNIKAIKDIAARLGVSMSALNIYVGGYKLEKAVANATVSEYEQDVTLTIEKDAFGGSINPTYLNSLGITYSDETVKDEPVKFLLPTGQAFDGELVVSAGDSQIFLLANKDGRAIAGQVVEVTAEGGTHVTTQYNYVQAGGSSTVNKTAEGLPDGAGVKAYVFKAYGMNYNEVPVGFGFDADVYTAGDVVEFTYYIKTPTADSALASGSDQYSFTLTPFGMWGDGAASEYFSITVNGIPYTAGNTLPSKTYGVLTNTWVTVRAVVLKGFTCTDEDDFVKYHNKIVEDYDTGFGFKMTNLNLIRTNCGVTDNAKFALYLGGFTVKNAVVNATVSAYEKTVDLTIENGGVATELTTAYLDGLGITYTKENEAAKPVQYFYNGEKLTQTLTVENGKSVSVQLADENGALLAGESITFTGVGGWTAPKSSNRFTTNVVKTADENLPTATGVGGYVAKLQGYNSSAAAPFSTMTLLPEQTFNAGDRVSFTYLTSVGGRAIKKGVTLYNVWFINPNAWNTTGMNEYISVYINGTQSQEITYTPVQNISDAWITVSVIFKKEFTGPLYLELHGITDSVTAKYEGSTTFQKSEYTIYFAGLTVTKGNSTATVSTYNATQTVPFTTTFEATVTPTYLNDLGITYTDGGAAKAVKYYLGTTLVEKKFGVFVNTPVTLYLATQEGVLIGGKTLTLTTPAATGNATIPDPESDQYGSSKIVAVKAADEGISAAPQGMGEYMWKITTTYNPNNLEIGASTAYQTGDKITFYYYMNTNGFALTESGSPYDLLFNSALNGKVSFKINGVDAGTGNNISGVNKAKYGELVNTWVKVELTFTANVTTAITYKFNGMQWKYNAYAAKDGATMSYQQLSIYYGGYVYEAKNA